MPRVKYIYGIKHPDGSALVYVGQTYHPRQRYKEHLRGPLKVDEWMRDLCAQGIEPEMVILDKRVRLYNELERELIAAAHSQNESLLNDKGVPSAQTAAS